MLLGRKRVHPSNNVMKSGIIDSKSQLLEQRAKEVMEIFQQETTLIPNSNSLPTTELNNNANLSSYNTRLLDNFSVDVKFIWSLAIALYKGQVQNWIRDLVFPGLSTQLEINRNQNSLDPFISAFTYLSFGQVDLACEESKKNNDHELSMYISHSQFKNVKQVVKDHMNTLIEKGQWKNMTVNHKRCWYTLAGHLGYTDIDEFVVTERVSWQCTLGMYIWYENRFDKLPSLERYNRVFDSTIINIHHLNTKKNTAKPNLSCLWYQLLQWWIGDASVARLDTWPLDLVWLLSIYKPVNSIDSMFKLKWVEQLERMEQSELAIYAALFLSNPDKHVNHILRQCEWTDENKLLNIYHIPSKNICMAKALNAHDDWNFDEEYKILLQGELYEPAKMSLLYFILPRYFKHDTMSIEKCLSFIKAYPQEKDEFIQTIEIILTYLYNNDKDNETSNLLIEKLQQLPPKYGGRNVQELFKNLTEAILF